MGERTIKTNAEHEALYAELAAVMQKYSNNMDSVVLLCVTANMLGKILAMQDQRKYTVAALLEMIDRNIEIGNKQMIDSLMDTKGNA